MNGFAFVEIFQIVIRISLTLVAGNEIELAGDLFVEEFGKLVRGVFSAPIDLPGTNFRRAQQASSLPLSPTGFQHQVFILRSIVKPRQPIPIISPNMYLASCFQAKKKMESVFGDLLRRRRSSPGESRDMVYSLLHGDQKTDCPLSDEQIIDFLMSIVFTGYEAMTETATMVLKYLSDDPRVLQEIRVRYRARSLFSTLEAD